MTFSFVLGLLLLGVCVGILSSALGLGGGILMLPAFVTFIAGMDAHTAKGTSLFIIIFVALFNAGRHLRDAKHMPWHSVLFLAMGSIVGSYSAAWLTSQLSEDLVLIVFIMLLLLLAIRTFFIRYRIVHESQVRRRIPTTLFIGLSVGIVGGSTGTGGGIILIPLALMAGIASNSIVVGLSNMVMVFTCLAGSIAHLMATPIHPGPWIVGHINFALVPMVLIGSQVGSEIGHRLNRHITLKRRRILMGGLLVIIILRLGYQLLS